MKKLFTLLFVSALAVPAVWAQTTQGSISVGGSASFDSYKNESQYAGAAYKSSSLGISPKAGYFVIDNLEVGVNLGFSSGKYGYENVDATKTSSFLAGPYARYYKFTSNERFAFTAEAGFTFGSGKEKFPAGAEWKTGETIAYLSPGFTYFLTDKWGLDLQLRGIRFRSYDPNKDADNNNQNTFTFGVNSLSPTLGFRYFVGR